MWGNIIRRRHGIRIGFQSPQASHLGGENEHVPRRPQIYGFRISCYGLPILGFPPRLCQPCANGAPKLRRACPSLAPGLSLQNHPELLSRILQNPPDSIWITQNIYLKSSNIVQNPLPESSRIDRNHRKISPRFLHHHWNTQKYLLLLLPKPIVQIFGTMP